MKDWQERLLEEKRELKERKERLMNFLMSDEFRKLDIETQTLLKEQYHVQAVYLLILERRAEKLALEQDTHKTQSATVTVRPTDDGYAGRGPSLGVQEEI